MNPVLIITAVPQEAGLLEQALACNALPLTIGAFTCVQGVCGTLPVTICAAGVGKINAAAATAALLGHLRPRLVINTGCAGAYAGSGLGIGDLAVADKEVLGDEGVMTSAGWLDLQQMKMPCFTKEDQQYFNEIPLSVVASEKAVHLAGGSGINLVRGTFITVSTCSGTIQQGEQLSSRFGGICENMEGGAVALTCLRYGVECLEVRGVSNLVEERNMKAWDIPRAVEAAQQFVLKYLEEMTRPE